MAINSHFGCAAVVFLLVAAGGCSGLDGLPGTAPDEDLFDGSLEDTTTVVDSGDLPDASDDTVVADSSLSDGPLPDTSVGADTRPLDMGVDSRPVDMGVDSPPLDMGVDSRPLDMGVDMGIVCASPKILCGETCLDPRADPLNCGVCDLQCATELTGSTTCASSLCTCPSNSTKCGSACISLAQDPSRCGSGCGATACSADRYCDGSCKCRPGLIDCGGKCIDPKGDANNCDGCGKLCKTNEDCINGACSNPATCAAPRTQCPTASNGNSCFDLNRDPTNCGACGTACAVDELCVGGGCVKYEPAIGCTSCPCKYCADQSMTCCPKMPGHALASCVEGGACPLPL